MNKIYLIRHGESEMNAVQDGLSSDEKLLLGRCNWIPLSRRGIKQAIRVGQYFKEGRINFDYISCSPAVRTQQTARYTIEQMVNPDNVYGMLNKIMLSDQLVERSWGEWDYKLKSTPEIVAFQGLLTSDPQSFIEYRPPMGESNRDVAQRVREHITDYHVIHEISAVFTHRGCICALLIDLFELNPADIVNLWMGPGSVSTITHNGKECIDYKTEIFVP